MQAPEEYLFSKSASFDKAYTHTCAYSVWQKHIKFQKVLNYNKNKDEWKAQQH